MPKSKKDNKDKKDVDTVTNKPNEKVKPVKEVDERPIITGFGTFKNDAEYEDYMREFMEKNKITDPFYAKANLDPYASVDEYDKHLTKQMWHEENGWDKPTPKDLVNEKRIGNIVCSLNLFGVHLHHAKSQVELLIKNLHIEFHLHKPFYPYITRDGTCSDTIKKARYDIYRVLIIREEFKIIADKLMAYENPNRFAYKTMKRQFEKFDEMCGDVFMNEHYNLLSGF